MLLHISQHSELTLQEQIIGQIRAKILSGELEPDEALMSIRALSKNLRVSINTVQRAYEHLLKSELIYAQPGRGFFVSKLEQDDKTDLARQNFSRSLRESVKDAKREGLSNKELKMIFSQLLIGDNNGNA